MDWVVPLLVAQVHTSLGKVKIKDATVLLDSGASSSIVSKHLVKMINQGI